jgi:small ligand-binding sensory domain FIST
MKLFLHAHATHPDWHFALALAVSQIEAQRQLPDHVGEPTLGWVYLTDHYADHAETLLTVLQAHWPAVAWVGAVGVGIAGNGVEYFNEPALSLMLSDWPVDQFKVFSGAAPLGHFKAASAQVHADPQTTDLSELVHEMSQRTSSGYVFGGVASSRTRALHIANGVFQGGLSGVAFSEDQGILSRVTQGSQPIAKARAITEAEHNLVLTLDGEPALDCLLRDLKIDDVHHRDAMPRLRETLVGLVDAADHANTVSRPGQFGSDTRVRHLIGLDPARRGVAIADHVEVGMSLAFCKRDLDAARRDLVRICTEIREALEPESLPLETALALQGSVTERAPHAARRMSGAVYVSCVGRGGPHFGSPSAELALIRHALGDVPLVGFFAAGEIARHHVYGYTGVLTVFTSSASAAQ